MADKAFLAVDLGASSGRHVMGYFDGKRLRLEELYRFENGPVAAAGHLYWNALGLWSHIKTGLRAAAPMQPTSLGVDTWGVDFALLGRGGELLGNPVCYRDARTDGMLEKAFSIVPRDDLFQATGVQFMQINTLFQLLAMRLSASPLLDAAESLLMMPDLFHWLLTGVRSNEITNATTSQCFDPREQTWARAMLERLGIPTHLFGELTPPGTTLGPLLSSVAEETGLPNTQVIVPGTHDTASAVLAVPYTGPTTAKPNWCYLSSGTWSLMGVELAEPVINEVSLSRNLTNEGGVGGTTRLLKNICGLWLIQECRRIWNQAGNEVSWDELLRFTAAAKPLVSLINPDAREFLAPANMPEAMRDYCRRHGQPVPEDYGAILRTAIDSLALRYRQVLGWLEELTGERIEVIHIVGGGSQNHVLNQATANACNRRVVTGPVEATAAGNVLMQAIAAGEVADIRQAREVVANSFAVEVIEPQHGDAWDEAYQRFVQLS